MRLRAVAVALAIIAATLSAVSAHAGAPTPTPTAPPGLPIERVSPPSQSASISQSSIPVQVTVEGITNLGAYEVLLTYDSALVTFLSATNAAFLGSTGRAVFCAPPVIQTLAGTMRKLNFGCGTIGSPPPFGPNGSGLLATVNFAPVAVGLAQLTLEPSLSDPLGVSLPAFAYSGEIDINPGPTPTPTNTPTVTPTNTPCPGGVCPSPTPVQCAPTSLSVPAVVNGAPNVGVDVPVDVANVCNIGAFEFTLTYNPSLVTFVSATAGAFMGSTGRSVQCPAPIILPASVRFGCVTLGSTPPFGAAGAGTIATLRFVPVTTGSSPLDLSAVTLLQPNASTIVTSVNDGVLDIAPCPACPTVTPTNTATATPTATHTAVVPPTSTPTPCPGVCPTPTHTPTAFVATATPTPAVIPATVRIDPPAYNAIPGVPLPVGIAIEDAVNLGGFAFRLSFDPARLSQQSFTVGPFLGSSGRAVFCAPGAVALPPGTVQFNCGSLGHTLAGPTGDGLLGTMWLMPLTPGVSALDLSQVQLTTPSAAPIPIAAVIDGSVTVASCGGPCPTPTSTPPATATPTPGGSGAALVGLSPAAPVNVEIGETFALDLVVSGTTNLGSFDVIVEHNQSLNVFVDFLSFQEGLFMGSTGRAVLCQPPIETSFDVRVACASLGGAPGPSGGGVLGTLTFQAIGPGINSQFGVAAVGLTDPLANSLPSAPAPRITVTSLPPGGTLAAAAGASTAPSTPRDGGSGAPSQTLLLLAFAVGAGMLAVTLRARRAAGGAVTLSMLGATALGAAALFGSGGGAAQGVIINAQPPAANLFAGAPPLIIEVRADELPPGAELASFDLGFRYDPSLVQVAAADGDLLGSTGRAVTCNVSEPAFFDRVLACTSSGAAPYASEDGVLARFSVVAAPDALQRLGASTENGGPLVLNLDQTTTILRDPTGATIPLDRVDDPLITMRVLEGDLDGDCMVGLSDRQEIISGYGSVFGDPLYTAAYDIEPPAGDGDLDVHDLQFVIGRSGSTCAAPVPVQAPIEPPPVPTSTPDPNADSDGDGDTDINDNCPDVPNPAQEDTDGDALGTACEPDFGTSDSDPDTDGDGCGDGREARPITFAPELGGHRDPADAWDFFDVTGDRTVDLTDAIDVLGYFGDDGTSPEGDLRDRAAPDALHPWRTVAGVGGVDLSDAIVNLASFGHDCTGAP